jgi:hypothetical protein
MVVAREDEMKSGAQRILNNKNGRCGRVQVAAGSRWQRQVATSGMMRGVQRTSNEAQRICNTRRR